LYGFDRFSFIEDSFVVKPRKLFQFEVVKAEVPNTSKIKVCLTKTVRGPLVPFSNGFFLEL
jgi:hypothetical protein